VKCCKYCRKPIRKHISEKVSLKKLKPTTEAYWRTLFLASLDGKKRWLGVLTVQTSTLKHAIADGTTPSSQKKKSRRTFRVQGSNVHANTTEYQTINL